MKELSDFRKNENTHFGLLTMLGKWRYKLDKEKVSREICMDNSILFDIVNHNLLVSQECLYRMSLQLMKGYLKNRKEWM